MPKSRKRKGKRGPKNGPQIPSLEGVRKLAKSLDSPELRELYRRQKSLNSSLDEEVEEMSKHIKEIFNHDKNS